MNLVVLNAELRPGIPTLAFQSEMAMPSNGNPERQK